MKSRKPSVTLSITHNAVLQFEAEAEWRDRQKAVTESSVLRQSAMIARQRSTIRGSCTAITSLLANEENPQITSHHKTTIHRTLTLHLLVDETLTHRQKVTRTQRRG